MITNKLCNMPKPMPITIAEFYWWAVSEGVENYDLCIYDSHNENRDVQFGKIKIDYATEEVIIE